jgi:hypothetical protein
MSDGERGWGRDLRLLFMRDAARRRRAVMHRVEAMLSDEDWAAFEQLRAGLTAEAGHSVGVAQVVREAVRRAAAAIGRGAG